MDFSIVLFVLTVDGGGRRGVNAMKSHIQNKILNELSRKKCCFLCNFTEEKNLEKIFQCRHFTFDIRNSMKLCLKLTIEGNQPSEIFRIFAL